MRTLPFDFYRCKPELPDANCMNCLRWADMPGQTWGERTPCVHGQENSTTENCGYTPIQEKK